jgi:hypothetical protein
LNQYRKCIGGRDQHIAEVKTDVSYGFSQQFVLLNNADTEISTECAANFLYKCFKFGLKVRKVVNKSNNLINHQPNQQADYDHRDY